MIPFVLKRLAQLIPLLLVISVLIFVIIDLPPGDFLTTYIESLSRNGSTVSELEIVRLRQQFGVDQPLYAQYARWLTSIVFQGDLGFSFKWNRPVTDLIGERLGLSLLMALTTIILVYAIAIPAGVASAVFKNGPIDYLFSFLGVLGLAVPGFLLALLLMWLAYSQFGVSITGLFSAAYVDAPWDINKLADLLSRVWLPLLIIGVSGTAVTIRVVRAGMLDEMRKQYVETARSKGLSEIRLLFKYPLRVALIPIVSTAGWLIPIVIAEESVISIVLNLPTTGPLLLNALLSQDMYLAGGILLIFSVITVTGTVLSDLALAWLDPRIRMEAGR